MMEERATVVAIDGGICWVEADRRKSCPKCQAGKGCGGGLLGALIRYERSRIAVENSLSDIHVGDEIIIGLDERQILKSSLQVYILPLMLMLGCGFVADNLLYLDDLMTAAVALMGLVAGLLYVKNQSARQQATRDGTVESGMSVKAIRKADCLLDSDQCQAQSTR